MQFAVFLIRSLIIFFLSTATVFGGSTGRVKGRVIDANSGEPLLGCNILIENTDLGSATDIDGSFVFFNVYPGTYSFRAQRIGFGEKIYANIQVNIDLTTIVDFELSEEALQGEVVTVNAETPLINKGLTASTAIVNREMLEKLPVTELSEVLNLQAGFISGYLRGGRRGEVAYWIDGVPMTDSYDGGTVVDVSKDMVEEMQLVSGAFNAEYGQAMSGIVNIVTKNGSNDFSGDINLYSGDFASSNSDIFWNLDHLNPLTTQNINLNLSGSLIPAKLYYCLNSRYIYYQGVHEGREQFLPNSVGMEYSDSAGVSSWYILGTDEYKDSVINHSVLASRLEDVSDAEYVDSMYHKLQDVHAISEGSGGFVPMDWNIKKYFQSNLIYRFSPFTKLKYSIISDNVDYQDYDRMYRLNPQGNLLRKRRGITQIANLNHALTLGTYFNLGLTSFSKEYSHKAFEDMGDYVHGVLGAAPDGYSFLPGGSNNNIFSRKTMSSTGKFDLTSQVTQSHQLKGGLEYRHHKLDFSNVNLQPQDSQVTIDLIYESPFLIEPQTMPDSSIHSSNYHFEPIEFSGYIQDKIELNDIIINAGVRFDYFDPRGRILSDPTDPSIYNPIKPENRFHDLNEDGIQNNNDADITVIEREAYWYRETTPKTAVSPRLGASFPYSDWGVIHFSYGHFFQIPRFELLYANSDFDLGQGTGNVGIIGNADLKPERTVSYELGIQQLLTNNLSMDATIYMRDIRDLTGTRSEEIIIFGGASSYNKYENSDFAFVRGLVVSFNSRPVNGLTGSLDYTFQIVKGTASDPSQARNAIAGGALPEVHLISLDWDQKHTLNTALNFSTGNKGLSLIGQFGSGLPYTPESTEDISTLVLNSAKKPLTWNVDVRAYWQIKSGSSNIDLYCRVLNLFDHLNHYGIYFDTGVADRTKYVEQAESQNTSEYYNTVEEWFNNETFYSNPRRIEIGVTYGF